MTRYYWQNQEAINEGLPPVTVASYHNPAVIKAYPFAAVLLKQLEHATNRPETPFYSDVTLAIQQTLHPPGSIKPEQDIAALRSCLTTLPREVCADGHRRRSLNDHARQDGSVTRPRV